MSRMIKRLLFGGVLAIALTGASWVGARATAGTMLGMNPPVSNRSMEFAFDGVPSLEGNPRAWVITYASSTLPGVKKAEIFVSPTGILLGTNPANLDRRLERWENSKIPSELRN